MKTTLFISLLLSLGIGRALAQSNNYKLTKPTVINSETDKNTDTDREQTQKKQEVTTSNSVTTTYHVKTKEYYQRFIHDLEVKKQKMKEDPYYDKKAKEINWYAKIDMEIAKAKQELLKLERNEN